MAAKGSAAKSASGAAMSKYDVEVEARLQALEAKVAALEASDKAQQEVDARFLERLKIKSTNSGTNRFLALPKSKWCGWR